MNILPKKRWHVRNKDNKERVRRDEENARLELKKEKERVALAETEARLALLRKKNVNTVSQEKITTNEHQSIKPKNINLFASEEDFGENLKKKGNEEYTREKVIEKEAYERKIGLLTYLGQSATESCGSDAKPWYLKKQSRDSVIQKDDKEPSKEKDIDKKYGIDPMKTVDKALKRKKKKDKKKHTHEKKSQSSSSISIEQLRKERLQREKFEKDRSERLLLTGNPKPTDTPDESTDVNPKRYNSQFNPHLVRHNHQQRKWKPY